MISSGRVLRKNLVDAARPVAQRLVGDRGQSRGFGNKMRVIVAAEISPDGELAEFRKAGHGRVVDGAVVA